MYPGEVFIPSKTYIYITFILGSTMSSVVYYENRNDRCRSIRRELMYGGRGPNWIPKVAQMLEKEPNKETLDLRHSIDVAIYTSLRDPN